MKAQLLQALPLLIGALLGILFVYTKLPFGAIVSISALIGGLGFFSYLAGRGLIGVLPVQAVIIWQFQVLIPIVLIALLTLAMSQVAGFITTWVSGHEWFNFSGDGADDDTLETISSAIYAAVAAFIGTIFLDDLEGQVGGLWPPSQIKRAIGSAFNDDVNRLKDEVEAEANRTLDGLHTDRKDELKHISRTFADLVLALCPSDQDSEIADPELVRRAKSRHSRALDELGVDVPSVKPDEETSDLLERIEQFEELKRAVQEDTLFGELPSGWSYGAALARARIIKKHLHSIKERRKKVQP